MPHGISWSEVERMVNKIENFLREKFDNDFTHIMILGIERGGLIPAVMLSHRLKIPMETICIQRYLEGTDCVLSHFSLNSVAERQCSKLKTRDYIVVDDICDEGVTLDVINHHVPREKQTVNVVLVEKHQADFIVNFSAKKIQSNWWVKFPWEVE